LELQHQLKTRIKEAHHSQATYYDKKRKPQKFEPGNKVFLIARNIKTIRPSKKLDYKQYGPFKIISPMGRQAYKLELLLTFHGIHPVFHVSLLEKCHADTIPG